jgi:Flp pilus assembly secretin CpaC
LTDRSLSILGKKIGMTRVSVYGEGKRTVGIFDVEVSYDVTRLAVELNRITGGGLRVSSVNGRIMLSGTVLDAVTLDKEKAYGLPAKLAIPMMVCIFPVLFVVILLPVAVRLYTGHY